MRPVVIDWVLWSVSLSVCHSSEPCKNGWTDQDAIWFEDSGGPKELCIRWGVQIAAYKGTIFRGKDMPQRAGRRTAVSCAKMAEPIEMSFGLWTLVGPRKHVLLGYTLAPPGEYDWIVRIWLPCKNIEPIEMPFGIWTQFGPRNHVLNGGPDCPMPRVIFRGKTCQGMPDDTLPQAVQIWLNWSRCCLGCGLRWEAWIMWDAHWRHLANTTDRRCVVAMRPFCQITFDDLLLLLAWCCAGLC